MRFHRFIPAVLLLFMIHGCAVVPPQSVELSTTVGRDVAVAYDAHKNLAKTLFSRMYKDVDKLIDEVYIPYQIRRNVEQELALYAEEEGQDYNKIDVSLPRAFELAAKNPNDSEKQLYLLDYFEFLSTEIRRDAENYRSELKRPIRQQERELLSAIDRTYNNIIYANAIVTGHLASVRKVHDAQEEVLNQFGIEDLRTKVSGKLATASEQLMNYVDQLEEVNEQVGEGEQMIKDAQEMIQKLFK